MYTALCCYFPPFQPTQSSSKKKSLLGSKDWNSQRFRCWNRRCLVSMCRTEPWGESLKKTPKRRKTAVTFRDNFWGWRRFTWPRNLKGLFFCNENPTILAIGGHHLDLEKLYDQQKNHHKETSTDLLVDFGFPALLLWKMRPYRKFFVVGSGPEKLARFIRERCLKGFLGFMAISFGHQQEPWKSKTIKTIVSWNCWL